MRYGGIRGYLESLQPCCVSNIILFYIFLTFPVAARSYCITLLVDQDTSIPAPDHSQIFSSHGQAVAHGGSSKSRASSQSSCYQDSSKINRGWLPIYRDCSQRAESYDKKVSVTGKAPRFRRWLTALRRFPRWLISLLDRPWLLEVTSLLVAWVALTAIIVTLAVHQGRPLPQWPQLISINSLIAIFTAILKASLIMPVAEGEP